MTSTTTRTPAVPGVLDDPTRNRGVAFSPLERESIGLTGRLPSAVLTLEQQARRVYQQLQRAAIAHHAIEHDLTLKQAALASGVSENLFDRIVDPLVMTRGGSADLPSSPGTA